MRKEQIYQVIQMAAVSAFALLSAACSTDTIGSSQVSAQSLHQSMSMTYNEDNNTTYFSAQFRVGGGTGTTVLIEDPAGLKINGRTPSVNSFLGTSYELSQNGFQNLAVFEFKTSDGNLWVNSIAMDRMFLRKADATVSVLRTYVVDVEAVNFGPADTISARIVQEVRTSENTVSWLSASGVFDPAQSKIIFSAAELGKLQNGLGKLEISRSRSTGVAQGARGGLLTANYRLRSVAVNIVDKGSAVLTNPLARN